MIGRVTRMAGRLRGRSAAELRERAGQAAAAFAERALGRQQGEYDAAALAARLAPGADPAPAALLAAFRARAGAFLPGPADPAATVAALRARCPDDEAGVLARAERLLAGRFDLLGHRDLRFGEPLDWHLDPVAGRRAPRRHWSRVPYLDPQVVGDHKVVWELNRMQWLATLGQAWAYTGEARWAEAVAARLAAWMDANPPKLGVNWASSLEVSFRAIAWTWALHLVRDAAAVTPALYARALGVLDLHARHLERYLSTYFSPNTHLTGEALGLVYLGVAFPELRDAARWRAAGQRVLEAWLPRQVHEDGTYFEQATQYHRYTAEFYVHLAALADAGGLALAPHVRPTLARLLEHLLHVARPDGTIPLLGDDDGGRLVQLDGRTPDDVRALLGCGAALLGRGDLAFGARDDVAMLVWLLGAPGLARFDAVAPAPPAETSRAFPQGGLHVLRDGWAPDARWAVLDCGPHGAMNCGHAHADALTIEVAAGGRPLLVDAGTYTYPGPERNAFRSTAAHNTLTVDGRSSSEPTTPFQWATRTDAAVERWIAGPGFTLAEGRHDGYASAAEAVVHRRGLLLVHGGYWVLRDRLTAAGAHDLALRLHAAPGLAARAADGEVALADEDGRALLRVATPGAPAPLRMERGRVSRQYGASEEAAVLTLAWRGEGPQEIVTLLLPAGTAVATAGVRDLPLEAGAGRALALAHADGAEDLLLLGDGARLRAAGVESDATWLWLRRDAAGAVVAYVALDATHAAVAGQPLFAAGESRPWRAGAPAAGALPTLIETS